jgi:hypothetical protein
MVLCYPKAPCERRCSPYDAQPRSENRDISFQAWPCSCHRLRQARSVPRGQPYGAGTTSMQLPAGWALFLPFASRAVYRFSRRGAHVGKRKCHGTGSSDSVVMHCCCDARGAVTGVTTRLGGDERTSVGLPTLRAGAFTRKRKAQTGDAFPGGVRRSAKHCGSSPPITKLDASSSSRFNPMSVSAIPQRTALLQISITPITSEQRLSVPQRPLWSSALAASRVPVPR